MRFWFLSYILLLIGFSASSQPQDLVFRKITTDKGLSHNTVYSIAQDQQGFMWFGTREGLNRFDSDQNITFYHTGDSTDISSNQITSLSVDFFDNLYVGTYVGLDRYNRDKSTFSQVLFDGNALGTVFKTIMGSDSSLYIGSNNGLFVQKNGDAKLIKLIDAVSIIDILEYKKGIFLVTSLQHIWLINSYGEIIKEFNAVDNDGVAIDLAFNINCTLRDNFGRLWMGTRRNGFFLYDESSERFSPVISKYTSNPLETNVIRALAEDGHGNIWVGTESGLFIYNPDSKTFKHYTQSFDGKANSLSDKAIYSIYRGQNNIMWLGTYFGGVNYVLPRENGFRMIRADGGKKGLSGKAVSNITEDKDGNLWIGTEDGGVTIWDMKTNSFQYLQNKPQSNSLNVDNVHVLYRDPKDNMWIGTFLGGSNRYNWKTHHFDVVPAQVPSGPSLLNNMVYAIEGDQENNIWIGTQAGLSIYDPTKDLIKPYLPNVFWNKFIYDIKEDNKGKGYWICVNNSDTLFYLANDKTTVKKYEPWKDQTNLGEVHGVIWAYEDSQSKMWFGTINGGLLTYDEKSDTFKSYTVADGLPNNYVYAILEDNHQNLWMSTNKGLSRFNKKDEQFKNYNISHGLPNNQFNFKSAYKDKNGVMYFGTINGLCYFHPDSLEINNHESKVYFSDLKLFNKSVPIKANGLLSSVINTTKEIVLDYSQNEITIEYAAINYFSAGENSYSYMLEGFDKDWNYVGNEKTATYTNLSPGEYVFKVRAANNDGLWSNEGKQIVLIVKPPFWMTGWAFALYLFALGGVFAIYRAFQNKRNQERMSVQIERLEKEKIREVNEHKINFFTYISHEFKTPLTLIIASIDKFLNESPENSAHGEDYKRIKRNAKRLHFLIEQLMEFRKIDSDHAKIDYSQGDIILFLEDTFNAFTPLFLAKGIQPKFTTNKKSFFAYFDSDKFEKIVTNLLSNAVKHTSEDGSIEMEIDVSDNSDKKNNYVEIILSDTGSGIDPAALDKIFYPFYYTKNSKSLTYSTGIGLALVKSLIELLNGTIKVESNLHRGTFITVKIPLVHKPSDTNIKHVYGNKNVDLDREGDINISSIDDPEIVTGSGPNKHEILVVEDSPEILNLLVEHFSQTYRVVSAPNGKEALEKINNNVPDVIISDIMMPEIDGLELCKEVKENISTSHVPVVLLTAKTTADSRLEGLDVGADIYINKPFNLLELDVRIRNLLDSRDKLRKHFLKFANVSNMEIPISNRDQDLLQKLTSIVESHLEDSDFNISTFTHEAGVSRTLLHLKLKKLVNLSASEFVRTIRLQKAAHMLKVSDLTISEIAYKVGYADPNYFTRSFREKYNTSPSDYKQDKSN